MLRSLGISDSRTKFFRSNTSRRHQKNSGGIPMPYFHGTHDGRAAFIEIAIIDAAKYRKHKQSKRPILRGVKPFKALIDTGATTTMITTKVVQELHLQPVTKRLWHSSEGDIWRTAYLFQLAFYGEVLPIGDSEEVRW